MNKYAHLDEWEWPVEHPKDTDQSLWWYDWITDPFGVKTNLMVQKLKDEIGIFAAKRRSKNKNENVISKNITDTMVTRYQKPRKLWANPKVPRVYYAKPGYARRTQGRRTGGFQNLEKKFKDSEIIDTPLTTAWTNKDPADNTISGVKVGTEESERDGRVYTIHSVYMKLSIHGINILNSVALQDFKDINVRIVVVLDTQTNGAQLTPNDVMKEVGGGKNIHSFRNLQFTDRFRVIWDKEIHLPRARGTMFRDATSEFSVAQVDSSIITYFHKWKNGLTVQCKLTTADIGSITNNSLHVIAVASNDQARLSYKTRIRFTSGK